MPSIAAVITQQTFPGGLLHTRPQLTADLGRAADSHLPGAPRFYGMSMFLGHKPIGRNLAISGDMFLLFVTTDTELGVLSLYPKKPFSVIILK